MLELPVELYKLSLFVFVVIFLIIRTGGLSFLFRLITRLFNLSYTNTKMKKTENIAYDLQLFKVMDGVNAKDIHDAQLIKKEMANGNINRKGMLFTSQFGYVGDSKKPWYFFPLYSLLTLIFFAASAYSYYETSFFKVGYYRVSYMDYDEFVSLDHITDEDDYIFTNKDWCEKFSTLEHDISTRSISCSHLLDSKDGNRSKLSKQIEKSDMIYRIFFWGSIFYFLIFLYLSIGLFNFHQVNKYILKLKKERL